MSTSNLAEQALQNLVNQFARPLDFLRELAQNSMDAGSPRIEISIGWDPPKPGDDRGVCRIHVDDFGEGMDEVIIDNQLTRLFSSTKEDDLTKIGKFGIGFTSIFAIRPDAVLLNTGRHGEYWELLFHADRSYEKRKVTEPVSGTRITLFKRMQVDERDKFIEEARLILSYWCEHSDTPITFWDKTNETERAVQETHDPFAAFEVDDNAPPSGPEQINRPLALTDPKLVVTHSTEHHEVVIGITQRPRYGFYNGGLTLLNTHNNDALGKYAPALEHLSFKVKNDHLEHTLTRDNVLQDDRWDTAMKIILDARDKLRQRLLDKTIAAAANNEPMGQWHGWLADEVRADQIAHDTRNSPFVVAIQELPIFATTAGEPWSLKQIDTQAGELDAVLMAGPKPLPVYQKLGEQGRGLIPDLPATRLLISQASKGKLFQLALTYDASTVEEMGVRRISRAEDIFVMPEVLDENTLTDLERKLIHLTRDLLTAAVGVRVEVFGHALFEHQPGHSGLTNRMKLAVGDFGGLNLGADEALCLNGPKDGSVFLRPTPGIQSFLPAFLRFRTLLLNRNHPLFRSHLLTSNEDLLLAASGLATALLLEEDIEGQAALLRMDRMVEELLEKSA